MRQEREWHCGICSRPQSAIAETTSAPDSRAVGLRLRPDLLPRGTGSPASSAEASPALFVADQYNPGSRACAEGSLYWRMLGGAGVHACSGLDACHHQPVAAEVEVLYLRALQPEGLDPCCAQASRCSLPAQDRLLLPLPLVQLLWAPVLLLPQQLPQQLPLQTPRMQSPPAAAPHRRGSWQVLARPASPGLLQLPHRRCPAP